MSPSAVRMCHSKSLSTVPIIVLAVLLAVALRRESRGGVEAFTGSTRYTIVRTSYLHASIRQRIPTISNVFRSTVSNFNNNKNNNDDDEYEYEIPKGLNASQLVLEAQAMRAKAQAIMAEALFMEQELLDRRSNVRKTKAKETDHFIDQWFFRDLQPQERNDASSSKSTMVTNAARIADRLQVVSPEQVMSVVDRLFERQSEAAGYTTFLATATNTATSAANNATAVSGIIDTADADKKTRRPLQNETEVERLNQAMNNLIEAVTLVDQAIANRSDTAHGINTRWVGRRMELTIRTRLKELRQTQQLLLDRKLVAGMKKVTTNSAKDASVEGYVRQALQDVLGETVQLASSVSNRNESATAVVPTIGSAKEALEKVALVPLWVPSAFLPFLIAAQSSTVGPDQVASLKDHVLLGSRFYVTSYDSVPGAAIFRGNLRPNSDGQVDTSRLLADIQARTDAVPLLKDQVQLFLLPDPEWQPSRDNPQHEGPKPVLLALSKDIEPDESKMEKGAIYDAGKRLMYPLAAFFTYTFAIESFSLNHRFFQSLVHGRNLNVLGTMCLPVVGGIVAMQVLQEVVHYWVAKLRGIRIGSPVPIPSPQVGLFGCVTPLRSFPSSRAALLDMALSGPLVTSFVSMGCILASALLTVRASPAALARFPVVPVVVLKSSLLVGTLLSWIASKTLLLPLAQPVPIHPLFVVGYSGLIASALNLLPIFRLDGGRACSAAMGNRQAAVLSVSMLLFLLSMFLSGGSSLGLTWGLIVTLFQRRQEVPARDEVTELDNWRYGAWLFSFLLSLSVLTPFPGAPGVL